MLPSKYLTSPEWTDDQKSAILFAPFREKSLNPHSWEKKMKFWTDALLECAQSKQVLILDLNSFTKYFERSGQYPKCLDTVAKEMVRTGKMKTLNDFQRQSNSWMNWGFDVLVRRPLAWGLTKLISNDNTSAGECFIIPDLVQKKSQEVLTHHHNQVCHNTTDNLMELSIFRERCMQVVQSEAECDVVIKQLELDQKLIITRDTKGNTIVKVCSQSEDRAQPPQQIELNIFRIQRVMKRLEQQIQVISEQMDRQTEAARNFVKKGKKTVALHQLRKRKRLQQQLEKKSSCVNTLHEIIHRIEESSSNEMVVKAYESGLAAIRQLTGDLTLDKVDKVLDSMQQVFEEQEEVRQAIAGMEVPGLDVSTSDLEAKLNSLVAMEGTDDDSRAAGLPKGADASIDDIVAGLASHTLDDLPDVPTNSPGIKVEKTSYSAHRLEPAL